MDRCRKFDFMDEATAAAAAAAAPPTVTWLKFAVYGFRVEVIIVVRCKKCLNQRELLFCKNRMGKPGDKYA